MRTKSSKKRIVPRMRAVAKVGLATSLATVVATGLARGGKAGAIHVIAGVGLVAFTVLHASLSSRKIRRRLVAAS